MDMNEKLHSGALYLPDDGEIMQLQEQCLENFTILIRPARQRAKNGKRC